MLRSPRTLQLEGLLEGSMNCNWLLQSSSYLKLKCWAAVDDHLHLPTSGRARDKKGSVCALSHMILAKILWHSRAVKS